MVRAIGLGKRYGARLALADVTFEVRRGRVAALLGPNGAGKTTTLRILSGFLSATAGDAEVDGWSVRTHPRQVKERIGYLPEGVPLYPEMRVDEYLAFRAGVKGVSRSNRRTAISDAIERCQLGDRRRQIIGTLSRGYRQRLGVADAIVARPPVLILDEPTSGLDPNQMRHMRALVTELGREHAVLLSTHILSEVEAVAADVVILREGRVVAADTLEALRARAGSLESAFATVTGEDPAGREPTNEAGPTPPEASDSSRPPRA